MQALIFQRATSFDLHVLGMPPAFILSQDQTLQKNIFNLSFVYNLLLKNWRFAQFSKNISFKIFSFFQKTFNTISNIQVVVNNFFKFFQLFLIDINNNISKWKGQIKTIPKNWLSFPKGTLNIPNINNKVNAFFLIFWIY